MKQVVPATIVLILIVAGSALGQTVSSTSLDVDSVSAFHGSGEIRVGVNLQTQTRGSSTGRLGALQSLGFFQSGGQWFYQVRGMQYPLVVTQLPSLAWSGGQWKLVAPGKVINRPATAPTRYAKR